MNIYTLDGTYTEPPDLLLQSKIKTAIIKDFREPQPCSNCGRSTLSAGVLILKPDSDILPKVPEGKVRVVLYSLCTDCYKFIAEKDVHRLIKRNWQ